MTGKDVFRELGELDPELVLDAAPDAVPKRTTGPIYRRLIACAASLVLILGALAMVGFDNVYAAVKDLLAFIPGVGIQPSGDAVIYTYDPQQARIESNGKVARLLRASFSDGKLEFTVHIQGAEVFPRDTAFYVNGVAWDPGKVDYHIGIASDETGGMPEDSTMLELTVLMEPPKERDRFQLEISGFAERLAFSMVPCQTYEQLYQIGSTARQNGIAITATAHRTGNELVVWCYETREPGAAQDELLGIGSPANGAYTLRSWLHTESGILYDISSGIRLRNRLVFQLAETDETATLHIPYLAMLRREQAKLSLKLPQACGTTQMDASVEVSLGTVRVVSVEHTQYHLDASKDRLLIQLAYDSAEETVRLYSMDYEIEGSPVSAIMPDGESGTTKYIEVIVPKGQTRLDMQIRGIYYYLMGEYSLDLDIQELP